jgi:hypothetical protein
MNQQIEDAKKEALAKILKGDKEEASLAVRKVVLMLRATGRHEEADVLEMTLQQYKLNLEEV